MTKEFNPLFPEQFAWSNLDSRIGSIVGERIAEIVTEEMLKDGQHRVNVPGLRTALCVLWDECNRKDRG